MHEPRFSLAFFSPEMAPRISASLETAAMGFLEENAAWVPAASEIWD